MVRYTIYTYKIYFLLMNSLDNGRQGCSFGHTAEIAFYPNRVTYFHIILTHSFFRNIIIITHRKNMFQKKNYFSTVKIY